MTKLSGPSTRDKDTGLTGKQEAFIQGLLTHKDMFRAYSDAYDVGSIGKAGILSKASELMDSALIQKRFRALTGGDGSVMYNKLTERLVIEQLKIEAMNPKNPANVRVRALEILGKTNAIGLFSEQKENKADDTMKADDLEQLIVDKLDALIGKPVTSH